MIKAAVLLALAFALSRALRRRSAAERHLLWVAALTLAALLPLLGLVVPVWEPEAARRAAAVLPLLTRSDATVTYGDADVVVRADSIESSAVGPGRALLAIWLTGAALGLIAMVRGRRRLASYGAAALPVADPSCLAMLSGLSHVLGVRRPVLLLRSLDDSVPVTWGILEPKILLPACSAGWTDERLRVVLGHELAHVRRADWGLQVAARVARSFYWFNPLFWLAHRQLCVESEQASDDVVLALGVERHDYAVQLLELARTLTSERGAAPALAIARPSTLEGRIRVVLDPRANRRGPTRRTACVVAVLGALAALPLAAVSVPDPGATILVRTTGIPALPAEAAPRPDGTPLAAIHDVRVSSPAVAGETIVPPEVIEYSTPPLYSDEARRRGIEGTVTLEVHVDADGRPDVQQVVQALGFGLDQNARLAVGRWRFRPAMRRGLPVASTTKVDIVFSLANDALNELIANDMATRVGPGVSPPSIVRRVAVQQTPDQPGTTRRGSVLLDVVLRENGVPKVVRIARSLGAAFDQEAVRAFEQWRFSPARKDGVPVKVRMSAEVTFHS
jgi:TonB family protein